MGYLPLPYNKDRNKVFYKEMDNGLIVCVGIESSSLYQDRRKTVSFYTALSYTWAMYSPILLPQDCYLRIGEILGKNDLWFQTTTKEEKDFMCQSIQQAARICEKQSKIILHYILKENQYVEYKEYICRLNCIIDFVKKQNLFFIENLHKKSNKCLHLHKKCDRILSVKKTHKGSKPKECLKTRSL